MDRYLPTCKWMVHLCRNRNNYEACKNCSLVFFVFILWSAPAIFYPFGAAAGDTQHLEINYDSSYLVTFSTPFVYFGRTYNAIYVRIQFYCQSHMNANLVICQFILYCCIWTDLFYFRLIITDFLHLTNLYQKLILLTLFPHMELKITLLRSGLTLMTLV